MRQGTATSRQPHRLVACVIGLLSLAGCGGGGGGGGAGSDPLTPPPVVTPPVVTPPVVIPPPVVVTPPTGLNAGIGGVLYFNAAAGSDGAFAALDLDSGLLATLRSHRGASASRDGTEFTAIESQSSQLLDADAHSSELVVFGRDGRAVARFGRGDFIGGPVKLSPDRQRLAFEYGSTSEGDATGDILNITDRSGRVIKRYSGLAWWDWLPDGRLVAAGGDTIYLIDAALGSPQLLRRFAGDVPTDLSVSPDGSQLAFGLGSRSLLRNHVHVMGVDGSGLRQLTTSASNEDAPAWSPDGMRIAVRQGIAYAALGSGTSGGPCPETWVVPASASSANLSTTDAGTAARKLVMQSAGSQRSVCAFSTPQWRARPTALAATAGSAITGSGLNSGLAGRVFYSEPGELVAVNLADGALTVWSTVGASPYPSADGSELAFIQADPDSRTSGYDQITFMRAGGVVGSKFEVAGSFLGGLGVARDGQRLAARFNDASSGGSYPITVFERGGRRLSVAPVRYQGLAWAPSGQLLLVDKATLGVVDAALASVRLLTTLSDPVTGPAYSPDGSRLAFAMKGHIWVMNADATNLRQLTLSATSESAPAWSPDGRQLIVTVDAVCPLAWVVPADGERVYVGDASVASTARVLRRVDGTATRDICLFSTPHWR